MSLTFSLLNDFHPLFRLIEDPFQSPFLPTKTTSKSNLWLQRQASTELTEDGNDIVVRAELPGVQKENLDIHLGGDGQSLTIEGRVRRAVEAPTPAPTSAPERGNATESETVPQDASKSPTEAPTESEFRSSFTRSLWLPHRVDGQKTSAELVDGVLTLRIPKVEDLAQRITIS